MTYYVVIDTNVIVSAMMSIRDDSATVLLLERFFDGDFVPVYSSEIMNEYREVLGRKKFSFSPQKINIVLSEFERSGILVEPSALGIVLPDMKDLPFYEVVMEKKTITLTSLPEILSIFQTSLLSLPLVRCLTF